MAAIACGSPCATVLLTQVQVPLQCMGTCFPDWQTDGWTAEFDYTILANVNGCQTCRC